MRNIMTRFVKDETASTAVEYGLIVAGIALAIFAAVQGVGRKIATTLEATQGF